MKLLIGRGHAPFLQAPISVFRFRRWEMPSLPLVGSNTMELSKLELVPCPATPYTSWASTFGTLKRNRMKRECVKKDSLPSSELVVIDDA